MGDVGVDYEEDLVMSQWLLSGAVGALVATVLSIVYRHLAERIRLKVDTAIAVQMKDAYHLINFSTDIQWNKNSVEVAKLIWSKVNPLRQKLGDCLRESASIPYFWNQFKHDFSERPGWGTIGETLKKMAQ